MSAAIKTAEIRALLRARYPAPEWALIEEVADRTGGASNYADVLAMNLWQSRGHALHGFEIKASRSDWLRELKKPAKAEAISKYCDFWWVVAPKGVVVERELPVSWGLLVATEARLTTAVNAPKLNAEPMTRAFWASVMRRAHERLHDMAREQLVDERAELQRQHRDTIERERTHVRRELDTLLATLKTINDELGIDLVNRWGLPPTRFLKLAKELEHMSVSGNMLGHFEHLATQLQAAHKTVTDALQAFKGET